MRPIFVFLLIFIFSLVSSSPTITFQNEDIQAKETILATIEIDGGNFTEVISNSNIEFLEGRRSVFIESEIFYYNQKHYLSIYPNREGNFTVVVKNILYKENGELKSASIEKDFLVKNEVSNNTQILSIRPGVVFYEEKPKIKFSNSGSSNLDVSFSFQLSYENGSKIKKINLGVGDSRELYFSPTKNFTLLEIDSYKKFSIPIIYSLNQSPIVPNEVFLKFNPALILKNIVVGNKENATVELFNFGEDEIKNIKISSNIKFIKTSELKNISERGVNNLTLYFLPENAGHFLGNLAINYEQKNETYSVLVPMNLFVLPRGSNATDFKISEKTCDEINGIVCAMSEFCEGNSTFTKGGEYCCLGSCKKLEENDGTSYWFIGILIFIVIGIVLYFLYKRSKKIRQKSPEEKLGEISKKYAERVQGKVER